MRNKTLLNLIILSFFIGTFFTLYLMYGIVEQIDYGIGDDTTNVAYASQLYLLTATIMSILTLSIKEITTIGKQTLSTLVIIFYAFSFILALITFYANPNNQVEVMAGLFFFMAGSLFWASSFFIKESSALNRREEIGAIHKTIRYILAITIGVMLVKTLIGLQYLLPLLSY